MQELNRKLQESSTTAKKWVQIFSKEKKKKKKKGEIHRDIRKLKRKILKRNKRILSTH